MVKKIVALCDRISVWGGYLSGLLIVLGLGLILLEIVLRNLLDRTLYITEEYSGYLMCALTFCALAYTLKERAHIRMTFLHKVVQGRPRLILDLICCVVGFSFCLYLAFYNSILVWDSVVTGSQSMQVSGTYLAIPQFFLAFGSLLMLLQFLGEFFRTILMLAGSIDVNGFMIDQDNLGR